MIGFVRNAWYMVGWAKDLPATPTAHMLIGEPIVTWRGADGALVTLEDRCPHKLAPLSRGQVDGADLRCMYHGLRFAADGRCVEIPGQAAIPPSLRARAFPTAERHSAAWVWMGDPAKADPATIPDFVGIDDPKWAMKEAHLDYHAHYGLIVDNLLDLTHVSFLHRASFGQGIVRKQSEDTALKAPEIERIDRGLRLVRKTASGRAPAYLKHLHGQAVDSVVAYDFLVPGIFLLGTSVYAEGAIARGGGMPDEEPIHAHFTCQAIAPMTDRKTRYFFATGPLARSADLTDLIFGVARQAFLEDQEMIEAQQLVIDRSPDARMRPLSMDKAPNLYNALVTRLIAEENAPDPRPAAAA